MFHVYCMNKLFTIHTYYIE